MFRKSRRMIAFSCLCALILMLSVTLTTIFITNRIGIKKQNKALLDYYIETYSSDLITGEKPGMPPPAGTGEELTENPRFIRAIFYSVTFSASGEVLDVDVGPNNLYSRNEFITIADGILSSGKTSGKYGILRFRVTQVNGCTMVAFLDNAHNTQKLQTMLRHNLIAGGIVLILLFPATILLSRWIIQPLEDNNRRQKQFISDAGHELKTPVSVIATNAELLSRQLGSNEWLDNIRYLNERMGEMITELLTLSQAENAHAQMEKVDLSRLVTGEVLPFESVAFEHGLLIQQDITEGLTVHGNRSQLSRLVSILLDNAICHSEGGKEIRLTLRRKTKNVVLTVENNGKIPRIVK